MVSSRMHRARGLAVAVGLVAGFVAVPLAASSAAAHATTVICPTVGADGAVSPAPAADLDWAGCDLAGADLSGATLSDSNLTDTNLTGANLSGATLLGVTLSGASLDSANFTGAALTGVASGFVTAATPPTLPVSWQLTSGYLIGPGADLEQADLAGADLAGADLLNADLTDAGLAQANLSGTDLASTDLSPLFGVSSGSIIASPPPSLPADWTLTDGYLIGPGANLSGASLGNANLTRSDLASVQSGGVTGTPSLPADWSLTGGYLIGPSANLDNADLAGLDLAHADLAGAAIVKAVATSTNLTGADLAGAYLEANLTGANLTGADLASGVLQGATVTDADLGGADLTGVDAYLVISGGITGTPASLPQYWTLTGGYLIGPEANLSSADLAGLNLTSSDLGDARLTGAQLAGADLANVNLVESNLTDADLQSANLSGDNFYSAILTGANLDDANLTTATLEQVRSTTGATFAGTIWDDTTCPGGYNSNELVDGCFSALDQAPPAADPAVIAGLAGLDGWYISPVSVAWNWQENGPISGPQAGSQCDYASSATANGVDPLQDSCTNEAGVTGSASYPVKIDTTQPAVVLSGAISAHEYLYGATPDASCATTDGVSGVGTAARLGVKRAEPYGTGRVTATCAGAVSVAGDQQANPVATSYTVVFGSGGFSSPRPDAVLARSARKVSVRPLLDTAAGRAIPVFIAEWLAKSHRLRVTLAGPSIKPVTATCAWAASARSVECAIKIPAGVRTGKRYRYTLTVAENLGTGFATVPAVGRAANPEVIHFK